MSRRSTVRVEQDRHYDCVAGRACRAPARRRRLAEGRGEGACTPRKTWWVRFRMPDGKRISEGYQDGTLAAVRRDEVARMLGRQQDPTRIKQTSVPTFEKLATDALELYTTTRTLRPATRENQRSFVDKHLVPYFRDVRIDSITRIQIREFIAHVRRHLADSTLSASLPTLTIILDYAVEKEFLIANPLRSGAPLWRADHQPDQVDPFTPSELRAILDMAYRSEHDFGVLVQIMIQTGLRPGEALALRRCDVDLDSAELHVRGTFSRGRMGPTKTRSSVRTVSLLHDLVDDDAVTRAVTHRLRALKYTPLDDEARLFPYTRPAFARRWTRVLKRAGVRYRKPHALRHSFASILLSRNTPPLYVQRAGGWRSTTILFSTYARWVEEAAGGASNRPISSKHLLSGRQH